MSLSTHRHTPRHDLHTSLGNVAIALIPKHRASKGFIDGSWKKTNSRAGVARRPHQRPHALAARGQPAHDVASDEAVRASDQRHHRKLFKEA